MDESRDFDLLESPLEQNSLIEASAGTGKTYAIAGIFLRMLLEKRFSVGEICGRFSGCAAVPTSARTERPGDISRYSANEVMNPVQATLKLTRSLFTTSNCGSPTI